jgi:hypothetical protein
MERKVIDIRSRKPSAQQKGREVEPEIARRYGGKVQPNSGAGPVHKLDISQEEMLISSKHVSGDSFRLSRKDLEEMRSAARARGKMGAMVITYENGPTVVLHFEDDYFDVVGREAPLIVVEDQKEAKVQDRWSRARGE